MATIRLAIITQAHFPSSFVIPASPAAARVQEEYTHKKDHETRNAGHLRDEWILAARRV